MKKIHALILSNLLLVVACSQSDNAQKTSANPVQVSPALQEIKHPEKEKKAMTITLTGTLHYYPMEGGFYGLETANGQKVLPMNLKKTDQQDGAEVELRGHFKDLMTIQQWGKPFMVEQVKIIKPGNPNKPSDAESSFVEK